MFKDYNDVLLNAKKVLDGICNVCPECNGLACKGKVPGCGAKGSGSAFTECIDFFKSIKLNMDAVHPHFEANTRIEALGTEFMYPFFVAPIGGMNLNYGGVLTEAAYSKAVIKGARQTGICAFTGDGPNEEYFFAPLEFIKEEQGLGIPTIKPWDMDKCLKRIEIIESFGAVAFAMDIDSASLINLKLMGKPVYTKSTEELKTLAESTTMPFIVKGIMTPQAAERCAEAGCYGIVVSSHGGRVLEDCPPPASMLPEIRKAVGNSLKIFVDGGVRCGADVFKCIALGADAALIGRPYAIAAHGGMDEGVKMLTKKIGAELSEIMLMTNCPDIKSITSEKIIMK